MSEDLLYRALVVSNLVTIHLKTGIGSPAAYCGATKRGSRRGGPLWGTLSRDRPYHCQCPGYQLWYDLRWSQGQLRS